jgi:cytochrome c-type biogenesis protein CcmE
MERLIDTLENTPNIFWIILGLIAGIVFIFATMYYCMKQSVDFFSKANEIEKMIRDNKPKDDVLTAIYALRKESFIRHTGDRLRELAKMAEIKYDVVILKR